MSAQCRPDSNLCFPYEHQGSVCLEHVDLPLGYCAYQHICVHLCKTVPVLPGFPVTRMFLATLTLSSELRAQSTIPLHPFMGKWYLHFLRQAACEYSTLQRESRGNCKIHGNTNIPTHCTAITSQLEEVSCCQTTPPYKLSQLKRFHSLMISAFCCQPYSLYHFTTTAF